MANAEDIIKTMTEAFQNAQKQMIKSAVQMQNLFQDTMPDIGQYGEDLTELELTRVKGKRQILRNLYVPHKGNTAEIDLVMVHEKGIFVFESKNYSGWIFGSAEQEQWTQSLPNGEKYSFYNPIWQNATHIAALAQYLKISPQNFFSCIVFSERCSLKKVPVDIPTVLIVKRDDLLWNLHDVLYKLPPVYNEAVVQSIANILSPLAVQDKETQAKHAETVQAAKERAKNSTVCPLCGRPLVKRRGKYGEFWGCSSYPNCRFTRNIDRN